MQVVAIFKSWTIRPNRMKLYRIFFFLFKYYPSLVAISKLENHIRLDEKLFFERPVHRATDLVVCGADEVADGGAAI